MTRGPDVRGLSPGKLLLLRRLVLSPTPGPGPGGWRAGHQAAARPGGDGQGGPCSAPPSAPREGVRIPMCHLLTCAESRSFWIAPTRLIVPSPQSSPSHPLIPQQSRQSSLTGCDRRRSCGWGGGGHLKGQYTHQETDLPSPTRQPQGPLQSHPHCHHHLALLFLPALLGHSSQTLIVTSLNCDVSC